MRKTILISIAWCLFASAWALSAMGTVRADEPSVRRKLLDRLLGKKGEESRAESREPEMPAVQPAEAKRRTTQSPRGDSTRRMASDIRQAGAVATEPPSLNPQPGSPQPLSKAEIEIQRFENLALANNPTLSLVGLNDAFDRYNDAIRQVARTLDAPLVDLDRLIPKRGDYFVDAVHLNDAGHDLVGELVSRAILADVVQSPTTGVLVQVPTKESQRRAAVPQFGSGSPGGVP